MLVFAGVRRVRRWVRQQFGRERLVETAHDDDHSAHGVHDHDHALELATVAEATDVGVPLDSGPEHGRPHRHAHRHVGPMPDYPFVDYVPKPHSGSACFTASEPKRLRSC